MDGSLQLVDAPPSPSILICDDEHRLRELIRDTLEGGGYALAEAADGDESLELARSLRPDLILLDMMMPGKTGLEVLAALRLEPEFAETRVVMLTARTQVSDRDAATRAGADRFLPKPFSPLELISMVDDLLAEPR